MRPFILTGLALLLNACGAPPTTRGEWTQCPPPDVELEDCVLPTTIVDGSQPGYINVLNQLCETPCQSVELLAIVRLDVESLAELKPVTRFKKLNALSIVDMPNLQDMSGLENLTSIENRLWVEAGWTSKLRSLRGLHNVEGHIEVVKLETGWMPRIDALQKVTSIDDLRLGARLEDISSLRALQQVGKLNIALTALKTLDDLSGLTSVSKQITINDNPMLETFGGFQPQKGRIDVRVTDNPKLPQCEAETWVARLEPRWSFVLSNNTSTSCDAQGL